MNRNELYKLLTTYLSEEKRLRHSKCVEQAMRKIAYYLKEDIDSWGTAGLLHDIDLEIVKYDLSKHGLAAAQLLKDMGIDDSIIHTIKAHNPYLNVELISKMDYALYSVDHLARVMMTWIDELPQNDRFGENTDYIINNYNSKKGLKEPEISQILECEKLGININDLIMLVYQAYKENKDDLFKAN